MEGHFQQHQMSMSVEASDNRFPQWSIQETREFLMIRADLDQSFMETKRNKLLWELIANKMKERGLNRSPDQCKCKWKNLVTRYKGCEAMEPESIRHHFPFYQDLQTIFAARMQRMLWNEASGSTSTRKKLTHLSSSSSSEEEEDSESRRKKKKPKKANPNINTDLREVLGEFLKKQMEMEQRMIDAFEARERERGLRENEWRNCMQALENERMAMERRWREREEKRRVREEARAETRDALVTQLLDRLIRSDHL